MRLATVPAAGPPAGLQRQQTSPIRHAASPAASAPRPPSPDVRRFGSRRDFALGCVAGSACLGMLIPPSVLMIVWCVLTELSIGKLFLAGVLPGLLAAAGLTA